MRPRLIPNSGSIITVFFKLIRDSNSHHNSFLCTEHTKKCTCIHTFSDMDGYTYTNRILIKCMKGPCPSSLVSPYMKASTKGNQ